MHVYKYTLRETLKQKHGLRTYINGIDEYIYFLYKRIFVFFKIRLERGWMFVKMDVSVCVWIVCLLLGLHVWLSMSLVTEYLKDLLTDAFLKD